MLKERHPIGRFIGGLIAVGLSSGFLSAAQHGMISLCYFLGSVIVVFTIIGFVNLVIQPPELMAFVMRRRGHSWLIYVGMLITIQALLVLGWHVLAFLYGLLVTLGFAWRIVGTKRLQRMTTEEYREFTAQVEGRNS